MSESKRFRKLMGFIQDNTCEGGDVDGVMDLSEIEDMLNELFEENEQLRQTTKTQQIRIYCQDKEIQKLNEQLNKIPNTIKEVWIE